MRHGRKPTASVSLVRMNGLAIILATIINAGAVQPTALIIDVERLRSAKGVVHACLTRQPRHFPDCSADSSALRLTVPAATHNLRFSGFPSGQYALTLFHDENNNLRLDTVLGIPREGFGFSRNPTIRFGAPRFEQVNIELGAGYTRQTIRMQYLL